MRLITGVADSSSAKAFAIVRVACMVTGAGVGANTVGEGVGESAGAGGLYATELSVLLLLKPLVMVRSYVPEGWPPAPTTTGRSTSHSILR